MCSTRNNPGPGPGQQNNNSQEFQWQGGLYPNLSGLFGGERGERGEGGCGEETERQSALLILLRLLGLSQDHLQPAPSAPPAEEDHQARHCHCHRQPDLIPIILSKCCQFSLQMTKHMVRVGWICAKWSLPRLGHGGPGCLARRILVEPGGG